MTDYSVRMRCQARTQFNVHCRRRGRRISGSPTWLCRQHYEKVTRHPAAYPLTSFYPAEQLAG